MQKQNEKKKQYMIDTSIIVDNPTLNLFHLYQNGENEVFINETVVEEMERHKNSLIPEVKWAARVFFRAFDKATFEPVNKFPKNTNPNAKEDIVFHTTLDLEDAQGPVELFVINRENYTKKVLNSPGRDDAKIIDVGHSYGMRCITNDGGFRVRAMTRGLKVDFLKWDTVDNPEDLDFAMTFEIMESKKEEMLKALGENNLSNRQITINYTDDKGNLNGKKEYYRTKGGGLVKNRSELSEFNGLIKPINMEQKFYTDLLEENFDIFAVSGSTGSGKTLIALAEGMKKVKSEDSPINGVIYMRYTVAAEDKFSSLGFRKGDEDTKLGYFSYPLFSNLNVMAEQKMLRDGVNKESLKDERNSVVKNALTEELIKEYNIEILDIAHARGITITNKFIIFDEAQNAPNSIIKLIGTRVGKNSSIVFMGDAEQVDHPYLSDKRNGLLTMLKKAYEDKTGYIRSIQLKETVRSDTAEWFQENLKA